MPKLARSRLLSFLSKPRYRREIAEYCNVSLKHVDYHLQEAIEAGQVLVSEKRIPQKLSPQCHKPEKLGDFLYVSRTSPFLVGNVLRLTVQDGEKTSRSNTKVLSIKFLPKTQRLGIKNLARTLVPFKGKNGFVSRLLDSFAARTVVARQGVRDQLLKRKTLSNRNERRVPSHAEKLRLFQALSDQPLPFLDIHGRFGISKQTVMGLVRKELLKEEWGPRDIGVQFKLTEKGRNYLRQLKTSARLEPQRRKNIFIRLKQMIFS